MYTILVMLIGHFCSKNGAIALIFHKNDDLSKSDFWISSILSQIGLKWTKIKLWKEYQKIKKEYEDHKRQKQQQDLMGFT